MTVFLASAASSSQVMGTNLFFFFTTAGGGGGGERVTGVSVWKRIALICLFFSSIGVSSIFPNLEKTVFAFLWNRVDAFGFLVSSHTLYRKIHRLKAFLQPETFFLSYLGRSRSFQSITSIMLVRSAWAMIAFSCVSNTFFLSGRQLLKALATYSLHE